MFKKIFFILSLVACCFEFAALAQLVPQTSRSVTNPKADNVNTAQSIVFVIGNDGQLHQIAVDSNGGQFVLVTGTVITSPAAGAIQVVSLSNTASTPFYVSPGAGAITNQWSVAPSYAAATVAAFAPPNALGDRATFENRGTNVCFITYLDFTVRAASSATRNFELARRSTYDTGGVSISLTNTAIDSTFAASGVIVKEWTTAPADGTFAGNFFSVILNDIQQTSGINQSLVNKYSFVQNGESPIVVRPGECIAIRDMNGANGLSDMCVSIRWSEARPN